MKARGLDFDLTFTSFQSRAIKTLHLALEEMGRLWLPEEKDWRLNERHYGGLTGLDKAETAAKHGDDQVKLWRRSFDVPPPLPEEGSPWDLAKDVRYKGVPIPQTESLKDTIARVLPYWEGRIVPELACGQARAHLRPRQFTARAGDAPVEDPAGGDHRAGDPDRAADRV
jgi:2,3-bisphosphoglycerate-dependent phosphoglycerate mutase